MPRQFTVLLLACAAFGCSPVPQAVPIVGPDGSPMLHVSCGSNEARCYQLAAEHCPMGYEIGRSAGSPGNFLVRCRNGYGVPPQTVGAAPVAYPSPSPYVATPQAVAPSYPPLGRGQSDPNDIGY